MGRRRETFGALVSLAPAVASLLLFAGRALAAQAASRGLPVGGFAGVVVNGRRVTAEGVLV